MKTLPMLIESLNKQTFKDFEVHFCDDGSDDGTQSYFMVSASHFKADFKFFYHRQEHKGMRLARNINQGIKNARGEYCVFVMGDSMLEEDYLQQLETWAEPDRMICGIRIHLDSIGGRLEGVDMDWRLKKKVIPEFASVLVASPWLGMTGNGLTIPTEAFRLYGPWWESVEGYGGEDNEIIARLFYKGYIPWSVPDLRLYHHWHKAQPSLTNNRGQVAERIQKYYLHGV